jgi:hypothetical protein
MGCPCNRFSCQYSLELRPRFESLHVRCWAEVEKSGAVVRANRGAGLDSQALAALGATCVDDGTATAGFHTDHETMGTGTLDFRWLISAFHDDFLEEFGTATPPR